MKITKAVIPVAGLGTRFLPATKALAKEMLPIVDKPCIQYIVEEAVKSGITQIILITSKGKRALEDHFDIAFELEYRLKEDKKEKEIRELQKIEKMAKFIYIRQDQPLGDGHAILQAKEILNNEPFAVLFGDDIYDSEKPALSQLIEQYEIYNAPVIALQKINKKDSEKYGMIDPLSSNGRLHQIKSLVEKPKFQFAPSNLAIAGKYIVTPELLKTLNQVKKPKSGELRLIDGMKKYIKSNPIYGYEIEGQRFDTGNKLGLLKASIHFGLKHPELKKDLKKYLREII